MQRQGTTGPEPFVTTPIQSVFLHVTKACNLSCSYCYFSANKPLSGEMTTDEFNGLFPQIVMLRPEKLVFTGGEPLMRRDIIDLLKGMRASDPQHHVLRCLNSNGHMVSRELALTLIGLVDEVRVSIDALANRNDAQRGAGNFAAALRALDTYYAVGFEPKALVTVTSNSLPDLEELLCLLLRRNIRRINLNVVRPIGRGKKYQNDLVEQAALRTAVRNVWQRVAPDRPAPDEPSDAECQSNCGVGRILNILPTGDVFPCHVLTDERFHCGNVRNRSLGEICRRDGFVGALSSLDFRELTREEERVSSLTTPGSCLGDVYAATKPLHVWRRLTADGRQSAIHDEQ